MSSEKGGSFSHFVAALLGVAVGGVAMLMSKKENRDKLKKQLDEVKKLGEKKMDELKSDLDDLDAEGSKKLASKLGQVKKSLEKRSKKNKTNSKK